MMRQMRACCAAVLLAACTERTSTVPPVAARAQAARLVLSDSSAAVGATLTVFARAELAEGGVVGSYTVRVAFDTTSLRFDADVPLDDGAMRATNATRGVVRVAGASPGGFGDGRLAVLRFVVLRANGAASLQLVVDEMHTVARAEVRP